MRPRTAVRNLPEMGGGVVEYRHAGGPARVATLERWSTYSMHLNEVAAGKRSGDPWR